MGEHSAISGLEAIHVNGVNGADGNYLVPPIPPELVAKLAQGEKLDEDQVAGLNRLIESRQATFGIVSGRDPQDLAEAGWGVITAAEDSQGKNKAILDALAPLLEHRREQTGKAYREFVGPNGYRRNEHNGRFLARHGVDPFAPADPARVPYYLLLVGDPELLPFRFQYQLDVQYAVGRIHFNTIDEYARYAESVVRHETSAAAKTRKRAAFFGVRNAGDAATQLSADQLVSPLADHFRATNGWVVEDALGEKATKAQLTRLMGGDQKVDLLFTASHGMGFPMNDPRQIPAQGALLCQDWPGPMLHKGTIPAEHYFAAQDVPESAKLGGLICFHFACFGGGTPQMDEFAHQALGQPTAIAPKAFVAALPQRLLAHPGGGALAVIGHVERAWGCSFVWKRAGAQLQVFESALDCILKGMTIGSAMDYFNERYAALATGLTAEQESIKYGQKVDAWALADLWTAHNDARAYVVLGDPAVRLR
jgi:hypothetical protein